MNEELDSQLSAMFDDELASAECELLARRLSRDEQLKARWGRYAVIGAAIRAERGVRLHARVATRVSHVMRTEPVLSSRAMAGAAAGRWWRPLAGAAVAAGVAAVSILWLRAQTPDAGALTAGPPLASLPVARVAQPSAAPAVRTVERTGRADSYVVPPATHGNAAVVPVPELANYVVAHSLFSTPVARGTLLSSFMTNDTAAGVASAVSSVAGPSDAQSHVQ